LPKWAEYTEDDGKLIKSYKNQSSEANIKFIITFDSKIMNKLLNGTDKMGLTELEKLFHLSSSISCCNTMNLYDENNKLKNFQSPEEILEYYYTHRLTYYELRRQNIITNLEQDLFLISTKARFILDVINDTVKIRNIPKAEVIKQLENLKYPKMVNSILTNLDKMTEKQRNDSSYGSYDFLIGMPIYNLTKEKVDELLKDKENVETTLTLIKSKTDKNLWDEDLKIVEEEYKKHMIEYCDYMAIDPKVMEGYNTSKTAGKKMVMKKRINISK
jgi:DNA topoisomerase-2